MITSIGNVDNTVDFSDESPTTFDTIEEATEKAREETEEYGVRTYVFKCVPVLRIDRGKIIITKLK
jgi:hypothetical protein